MGPLDDIVSRLRVMAQWDERRQRRSYLLQSAADEIERLRLENAQLSERIEKAIAAYKELAAQSQRRATA